MIVGVESDTLKQKRLQKRGNTGQRCIVYLMVVREVLTLSEYFHDARFESKKPKAYGNYVDRHGDNIYHLNDQGQWEEVSGHEHFCKTEVGADIYGDRVFVSDEFFYFGDAGVQLLEQYASYVPNRSMKYSYRPLPELYTYALQEAAARGVPQIVGEPIDAPLGAITNPQS